MAMKIVWQYTRTKRASSSPWTATALQPLHQRHAAPAQRQHADHEGSDGRVFEVTLITRSCGSSSPLQGQVHPHEHDVPCLPRALRVGAPGPEAVGDARGALDVNTFRVPGAAAFGDRVKEVSVAGCVPYGGCNALCVCLRRGRREINRPRGRSPPASPGDNHEHNPYTAPDCLRCKSSRSTWPGAVRNTPATTSRTTRTSSSLLPRQPFLHLPQPRGAWNFRFSTTARSSNRARARSWPTCCPARAGSLRDALANCCTAGSRAQCFGLSRGAGRQLRHPGAPAGQGRADRGTACRRPTRRPAEARAGRGLRQRMVRDIVARPPCTRPSSARRRAGRNWRRASP